MKIDWWLVVPTLLLLFIGLVVLRSVAPSLVLYQGLFLIIAVIVFLIFSATDFQIPFTLFLPSYLFSIIFLILPSLFGLYTRGTLRWIQIGQFSLQPSEIIKPFLLITFSVLAASEFRHKSLLLFASFIVPVLIIFLQPDLGTALIISVGWITVLFSRLRLKHIFIGLLALGIFVYPATHFFLKSYQKDRLLTYVDPYRDPLGQGYHVIQSLIAVGSGQFFGRGLGHGTQSQLRFLPEHHTDFIFASLSEELGFVGSTIVITLFAVLLWRIYRISHQTTHPAGSLFCLSVLAMLAFQIFVNIGMNMGIAPITGITLPFLSYGGSSLLSLSITLGLINSISGANRRN